ncbi:hypothetical protein MRX96_036594 [Rhipicephalus microplus]
MFISQTSRAPNHNAEAIVEGSSRVWVSQLTGLPVLAEPRLPPRTSGYLLTTAKLAPDAALVRLTRCCASLHGRRITERGTGTTSRRGPPAHRSHPDKSLVQGHRGPYWQVSY